MAGKLHPKARKERQLQEFIVDLLVKDGFTCEEFRPGYHAHYQNKVVCDILAKPNHPRWAELPQEWFVIECKIADTSGLKMAKAVWQAISYSQSEFTTKAGDVVNPWMTLLAFQPEFGRASTNKNHILHPQYVEHRSQMRVARYAGVGTFELRVGSGWTMKSPYIFARGTNGEYGVYPNQFFPRKSGNTR